MPSKNRGSLVIALPWLLAVQAVLIVTATPADAQRERDDDAIAMRQLRRAAEPQRDNSNLPMLMSLRQMRDPALESFFRRLVQVPDWQVQVHAVLGLAEIAPDGRIDPYLVTRIDPRGHEHVIAHGIDQDMLGDEQITALLDWPELEPMPRLLLLAERVLDGKPIETESLNRMKDSGDLRVAGLSTCLLVQVDDRETLSAYRERLAGLSRRDRDQHLTWVFEAIRQYRLTRSLPLVRETLEEPSPSRGVLTTGLRAYLELDPGPGVKLWERFFDPNGSDSQKVRFALMLAAAAETIPPEAFELLPAGDSLIGAIAGAGRAVARRRNPVPPFTALLDLGHLRSTNWVMSRCRDLPAPQAAAVYTHLLETITSEQSPGAERIALAVKAAARLFELEPDAVIVRLNESEDDSLAMQMILLGLFESTSPRVADAVSSIRRIGPRRTDSLALLLVARHAERLDQEDRRALITIAAGGGRVSDMLQIQAAWLYLRHAGTAPAAVAGVFTES